MKRQGLTIVEVLVALAVIGIIFVVLANSQVLSLRVTSDSQRASTATQVANRAIEQVSRQVMANFSQYLGCPLTGDCSVEGVSAATYSITGFGEEHEEQSLVGLVRIDIVVTDPAPVSMSHYLSCMDVTPNPTIVKPEPCPWELPE